METFRELARFVYIATVIPYEHVPGRWFSPESGEYFPVGFVGETLRPKLLEQTPVRHIQETTI